jgi:hypothetical protein
MFGAAVRWPHEANLFLALTPPSDATPIELSGH